MSMRPVTASLIAALAAMAMSIGAAPVAMTGVEAAAAAQGPDACKLSGTGSERFEIDNTMVAHVEEQHRVCG